MNFSDFLRRAKSSLKFWSAPAQPEPAPTEFHIDEVAERVAKLKVPEPTFTSVAESTLIAEQLVQEIMTSELKVSQSTFTSFAGSTLVVEQLAQETLTSELKVPEPTFTSVAESRLLERKIESVFFELPFHLRFKSDPYKDKRMFVVAGLKYSYDVQTNSKSRKSLIKIAPHDFQYEVGVGMQIFYPYFIFSPEIKFSRGIGNILIYDRAQNEARILENVVSQIFTLSFNFEG